MYADSGNNFSDDDIIDDFERRSRLRNEYNDMFDSNTKNSFRKRAPEFFDDHSSVFNKESSGINLMNQQRNKFDRISNHDEISSRNDSMHKERIIPIQIENDFFPHEKNFQESVDEAKSENKPILSSSFNDNKDKCWNFKRSYDSLPRFHSTNSFYNIPIKIESKEKPLEKPLKKSSKNNGSICSSSIHASSEDLTENMHESSDVLLERIHQIEKQVNTLVKQVDNFQGDIESKDYRYLDEMLTRNMVNLDNIDPEKNDTIRSARKALIKKIQNALDLLESHSTSGFIKQNFPIDKKVKDDINVNIRPNENLLVKNNNFESKLLEHEGDTENNSNNIYQADNKSIEKECGMQVFEVKNKSARKENCMSSSNSFGYHKEDEGEVNTSKEIKNEIEMQKTGNNNININSVSEKESSSSMISEMCASQLNDLENKKVNLCFDATKSDVSDSNKKNLNKTEENMEIDENTIDSSKDTIKPCNTVSSDDYNPDSKKIFKNELHLDIVDGKPDFENVN